MFRVVVIFALMIIAIILLFRLSAYSLMSGNLRAEIVLATVAVVFLIAGLYINRRVQKKSVESAKEIDKNKIEELGLSNREYEVLEQIAQGLSNKEIANKLFVSESTVKTHVSNLFIKLDAQRRTQAIQIAKESGIL